MTAFEIVSVVFGIIAIIVSVAALLQALSASNRANVAAEKAASAEERATTLSAGNIELLINERLTATKERVSDITMQMASYLSKENRTSEDDKILEILEKNFRSAIENDLNATEVACSNYIDGKVDKARFEKTYRREIQRLVENAGFKEYFDPITSDYKAIIKVYNEWFNLEK